MTACDGPQFILPFTEDDEVTAAGVVVSIALGEPLHDHHKDFLIKLSKGMREESEKGQVWQRVEECDSDLLADANQALESAMVRLKAGDIVIRQQTDHIMRLMDSIGGEG